MKTIEGWKTEQMGALIKDIGDGGTPDTNKKDYFGGQIPWVVIQDICKDISTTKTTLTSLGLQSCSTKLWPAGTVILSTGATIGEVGLASVPLATKQGIHGIVCKEELSSRYLYYKLQTLRDFLCANAQGSTIREVRAAFLRTVPITFPKSLLEQTKIAEILSTVDRAIEQTEALIAKQQRIKTGLMQDLLTRGIDEHGNLRSEETHQFKDSPLGMIPVEWEVKKLLHLVDIAQGQKDPRREPYCDWPLVAPDHIESKTGLLLNLITAREQRAISGKYEFAPGDILYSKIRPYLKKAVLVDFAGLCSADIYPMRPKREATSEFILLTILGEQFSKYAESVSERSGFPKINRGELACFLVATPPISEQKRIAFFLNELSRLSGLEKKILHKLHSLKTALMQDLLTGKVRVIPLLDETEVTNDESGQDTPAHQDRRAQPCGETTAGSACGAGVGDH